MTTSTQMKIHLPTTQAGWARIYAQFMVLFALQGFILLGLYAWKGFNTSPEVMPVGFQLDPLHSVIHLVSGLIGSYIGFSRPSAALSFVRAFAIFYLLLAVFGTFTPIHFGMQLALPENALHWGLGLTAAAIGFGLNIFQTVSRP